MKHHPITINLKNGHAVPALPPADDMRVHDTVSYSSPDGKARVVFDSGSPFGNFTSDTIYDSEVRTLRNSGTFPCKCFITPHEVGWFAGEQPESGGDHDVKP
jgi:hypothetical protein